MSCLHFCKYPENTRYTLSKQALGLWPCDTSLISSMEFPLHFPPSSAGWPQPHRFFSLPLQKPFHSKDKEQNKPFQSEILMADTVAAAPWLVLQCNPCSAGSSCTPVPTSAALRAAPAQAGHELMEPSGDAGWRENANTLMLQPPCSEPRPEAGTGFKVSQNNRLSSQLSP